MRILRPHFLLIVLSLFAGIILSAPRIRKAESAPPLLLNSPPVAVNDSYSLHSDNNIHSLNVLFNDSDPDGDPLHPAFDTFPQHGQLTFGNNNFGYQPEPGYNGSDSFTYKACDNHDACSVATVSIQLANATPVAGIDLYDAHGFTTIGPFLANDMDPDGDPISVSGFIKFTRAWAALSHRQSFEFRLSARFGIHGHRCF